MPASTLPTSPTSPAASLHAGHSLASRTEYDTHIITSTKRDCVTLCANDLHNRNRLSACRKPSCCKTGTCLARWIATTCHIASEVTHMTIRSLLETRPANEASSGPPISRRSGSASEMMSHLTIVQTRFVYLPLCIVLRDSLSKPSTKGWRSQPVREHHPFR